MTEAPSNPYSPGAAIADPSGVGFFGREETFEFVRAAIQARLRTPIILYGQRRIGKSSILRQIPHHLSADTHCVYYDLQGKAGMKLDQVLFGLAREIGRELGIAMPQREEAQEETFITEFLPRAIAAVDGRPDRIVLLFDEFDVLDEQIAGSDVAGQLFIAYLGNLITVHPEMGYAMVVGRKTEELSEEFNSTLLKNSVQQHIGRLDEVHAYRLVRELAATQNFLNFSDAALDRIYELTAGHPFCVQLLCFTIWTRSLNLRKQRVDVTPALVEDAILPALEYGTHGLNWIFDGLSTPAYRLFLSALAESRNPLAGEGVPFASIERLLVDHKVTPDGLDFARAPEDLERWDIISRQQDGYHFQVSLIGMWIRQARPLALLEKEVRYTNPRAYQYYELGKTSHEAGDLDRAITDYQGALKANPYFFEAQRDLAIALRERGKPFDLETAIEAYERALEIDKEMPTSGLVQALLDALEAGEIRTDQVVRYHERLGKLDDDGSMKSRGYRILMKRALQMLRTEQYGNAEAIFVALNELEQAKEARQRARGAVTLNASTAVLAVAAVVWRVTIFSGTALDKSFLGAFIGASIATVFGRLYSGVRPAATIKQRPFLSRNTPSATIVRLLLATVAFGALAYISHLVFRWEKVDYVAGVASFYAVALIIAINRGSS